METGSGNRKRLRVAKAKRHTSEGRGDKSPTRKSPRAKHVIMVENETAISDDSPPRPADSSSRLGQYDCDSSDENTDDTEDLYYPQDKQSPESQGTPPSPPTPLFSQDSLDACIKTTMSNWCMVSSDGASLLHILQIEKFTDTVCSPSHFMDGSQIISKEVLLDFDTFLLDITRAMRFSIKEMPVSLGDKKCMFGGYTVRSEEVTAVFKQLRRDQQAISDLWEKYKDVRLLSSYCTYALDFIKYALKLLTNPWDHAEPAYERLFSVFASICGLMFEDASAVKKREMRIYNKTVTGKADLRAYVENIHLQNEEDSCFPFLPPQTVSCLVEVKTVAPTASYVDTDGKKHIEACLGQLIAELLGELRCRHNTSQTVCATEMLGVAVLSTRVQFLRLHIPMDSQDLYERDVKDCVEDPTRRKGALFVTRPLDFFKAEDRKMIMDMLRYIACITHVA